VVRRGARRSVHRVDTVDAEVSELPLPHPAKNLRGLEACAIMVRFTAKAVGTGAA